MRLLALIPLLVFSVAAEKARFDNYRLYSVLPENLNQIDALRSFDGSEGYDFWTEVRQENVTVDIMVPPHKFNEFNSFLDENDLKSTIKIENIQSLIDDEELSVRARSAGMEWTNYHTLQEVYDWMDELAEKYPETVKVVVGGKSYEGRELRGLQVTNGPNLPGVLLECGIHAREWIAPAATTWMVNEMLAGRVSPVFKKFNYLYFPFLNPDGYHHTWTANRMWRKTRTPYKKKQRTCYGADPNRNWDYHWNEIGTSNNPCDETYCGPSAFSEVEMKTFSQYVESVHKEMKLDVYVAYHAYSQLLMYPWGYTTQPSKDEALFKRIGDAAVKALAKVHGMKFTVGNIANTIYPTSGTSLEWYYGRLNATLSYVYELRDTGKHGFLLPPNQILPSAEELLPSLEVLLSEYQKLKK